MTSNSRLTILAVLGLGASLTLSPAATLAQQAGGAVVVPGSQQQEEDGQNSQATFDLETPIIDLGTILDTEPATGTIRFRNTGNTALMVPSVSTTCGCTVAELPKNEFAPGESVELEVEFDPRGKTAGRHEQTVTFRTSDPANPMVAVKVRAFVKPLISIEPMQVNLGQVTKHTRKETLIKMCIRDRVTGAFTFEDTTSCYADFDGDGRLNIFDFLAFQNAFATGDAIADCDGDGALTLFDFLCFQNAFAGGC